MQEEPRKAEGTEFSKQTATVEGLFFYNGGGSREKSCTCVKPTFALHQGSPGYSKFNANAQQ